MNWPAIVMGAVAGVLLGIVGWQKQLLDERSRLLTERTSTIADTAIEIYEETIERAREHSARPAYGTHPPSQPLIRRPQHSEPMPLPINLPIISAPPDPWYEYFTQDN